MNRRFSAFDGYLFDLDGCLYEGDRLVDGAETLVEGLRAAGKRVAFLSNNSTLGADEVAAKLGALGISAAEDEVLVPTDWAGEFLRACFGLVTVYPIGSPRVLASLRASGHRLAEADEAVCDVVFVARDLDFTYQKMEAAARFVQAGATLVTANPDLSHPGSRGFRVPETGALAASIASVAGSQAQTLGKPGPYLFAKALDRLGLAAGRVVMVGDTLETDMAGARAAGVAGVWINRNGQPCPADQVPWRTCQQLNELTNDLQHSLKDGFL